MNTFSSSLLRHSLILAGLASSALAQDSFLLSFTQNETSMSGSGGTSLQTLRPNEIHELIITSAGCATLSSEKWAPRGAFMTQSGDADGDDLYWDPAVFGAVDAIMAALVLPGTQPLDMRDVYFSPAVDLGTAVSGSPGLRAGDVGRIVRTGTSEGQVQHFVRAEQIQMALGLPPSPIVVNVDAVCASPNYGVFFSLEDDHTGILSACGLTSTRDGDIWLLPPWAFGWSPQMTVAGVTPNSAIRIYSEITVDQMVFNSRVTNRFGVCQTQIGDTDALAIDFTAPATTVPTCAGPIPVPTLLFAGENLTGSSILENRFGGRIRPSACGNLGTYCGSGPTFGDQVGLMPPSTTTGVAASVNGLELGRACRFVIESPTPLQAVPASITIDVASPAAFTWLFVDTAPAGPAAVMPSVPFGPSTFCYPDVHLPSPLFVGFVPTAGGFGSFTTPPVGLVGDFVWQGITVFGGTLQLTPPITTELF